MFKIMKVLITGANGQLAKAISIQDKRNEIIATGKNQLDVTDKTQCTEFLAKVKPDIVYHFASMTRGDECAANPQLAYKVNVVGTRNLARATAKLNIPILFVSTNEVFDGKKSTPYTESDTPNPKTIVGKNKLEAEKIVAKTNPKHYIVRTMWLYSKWSNNFIHAILKKATVNKTIKLVYDEIGSPTNTLDLAKAITKLTKTNKFGVYHLANKGSASRMDFGEEVFQRLGIDINIIPVSLNDYKRLSKPPLYSVLGNVKAKKLGITMRGWKTALKEFLSKEFV